MARHGPPFAALVGTTSLAILLQGIFAGVFIEPGSHHGWLDAHNVGGDVAGVLAVLSALYAVVYLRAARDLVIGSVVLAVLVIALIGIGHAIVDSNQDGLTPLHVPLALLAFGLTVWLSIRVRALRRGGA